MSNVVTSRASKGLRKVRSYFKVCLTLSQPGLARALKRLDLTSKLIRLKLIRLKLIRLAYASLISLSFIRS